MLDSRVETFLAVCKNKSYTKASEELCITQPAVTQHIQYLEKRYNCKLLHYSNKELNLTKAGEVFYKYIQNAKANEKIMERKLREIKCENRSLKFGATLTIGEFTLSPILGDFIKTFNEFDVTMYVDNTKAVLEMLQGGDISFALVEGLFNKADYETRLIKMADFILIAPISHPLARRGDVFLEDLKDETIIVREKGSGSREVLERGLFDKNYTLENFRNIIEIGNVNVMKNMVERGIGLSFMYKDAVREELQEGSLAEIRVVDFQIQREFNFIHMKNELVKDEAYRFFSFFEENLLED